MHVSNRLDSRRHAMRNRPIDLHTLLLLNIILLSDGKKPMGLGIIKTSHLVEVCKFGVGFDEEFRYSNLWNDLHSINGKVNINKTKYTNIFYFKIFQKNALINPADTILLKYIDSSYCKWNISNCHNICHIKWLQTDVNRHFWL